MPRQPKSVHIVDQYLDVARFLGAKAECPQFPFYISEQDDLAAEEMLAAQGVDRGDRFVSVNPASALSIKQWGAENYASLLDRLNVELGLKGVVVTADKAVSAQVAGLSKIPFVNLAGRTSLKQLGAVLGRSAVHICGDTGSAQPCGGATKTGHCADWTDRRGSDLPLRAERERDQARGPVRSILQLAPLSVCVSSLHGVDHLGRGTKTR